MSLAPLELGVLTVRKLYTVHRYLGYFTNLSENFTVSIFRSYQ